MEAGVSNAQPYFFLILHSWLLPKAVCCTAPSRSFPDLGEGWGPPPQGLGSWQRFRQLFRGPWKQGGKCRAGAVPVPLPTSGAGRETDGHSEVHRASGTCPGGADGIVARLQQGQLGQEQGGGHLDGRELLQHLHDGGVLAPFPLLVLLQTLNRGQGQKGTCSCDPWSELSRQACSQRFREKGN